MPSSPRLRVLPVLLALALCAPCARSLSEDGGKPSTGQRVEMFWDVPEKWSICEVTSFNAATGEHTVKYDSGFEHTAALLAGQWRFREKPGRPLRSKKKVGGAEGTKYSAKLVGQELRVYWARYTAWQPGVVGLCEVYEGEIGACEVKKDDGNTEKYNFTDPKVVWKGEFLPNPDQWTLPKSEAQLGNALNMMEIDVDKELIAEVRDWYEHHVLPYIGDDGEDTWETTVTGDAGTGYSMDVDSKPTYNSFITPRRKAEGDEGPGGGDEGEGEGEGEGGGAAKEAGIGGTIASMFGWGSGKDAAGAAGAGEGGGRKGRGYKWYRQFAGGKFGSDIKWVSGSDIPTLRRMNSFFDRLGISKHVGQYIDWTKANKRNESRVYIPSFVVRVSVKKAYYHLDWPAEGGSNGLTFMSPLYDMSNQTEGCNLLYKGGDGSERVYKYTYGKAAVFGGGLSHSSEPCKPRTRAERKRPWAFLCFNFGTDSMK